MAGAHRLPAGDGWFFDLEGAAAYHDSGGTSPPTPWQVLLIYRERLHLTWDQLAAQPAWVTALDLTHLYLEAAHPPLPPITF